MHKGLIRSKAYDLVQGCAMKSWKEKLDFKEILSKDKAVSKYLTLKDLERIFDLDYYLRNVHKIFKRLGL
jgi:adenylosuccinate lyase